MTKLTFANHGVPRASQMHACIHSTFWVESKLNFLITSKCDHMLLRVDGQISLLETFSYLLKGEPRAN